MPKSVLHIIHVYFNFNPDQASAVYLQCIIHRCALWSRYYGKWYSEACWLYHTCHKTLGFLTQSHIIRIV